MLNEFFEYVDRRFRMRWCGYDRHQVDSAFALADQDMALVCLDRDAALATALDLTRQLEALRSEIAEYRLMHAGYPHGSPVAGCMRYLIHMARLSAMSLEAEARNQADELIRRAEEMVTTQAALLDEAEQESQRRLSKAVEQAEQIIADAKTQTETRLEDDDVHIGLNAGTREHGGSAVVPIIPRQSRASSPRHALRSDRVVAVDSTY